MKFRNVHLLSCSVIAILLIIFIVPACKKSSSSPSSSMTGSINGVTFNATSTSGVDVKQFNQMSISGLFIKGGDTSTVTINLADTVVNHEILNYTTGNDVEVVYFPNAVNGGSNYYSAESDLADNVSVTINSIDTTGHRISGTFNGVLYLATSSSLDSVKVTNGQFTTAYIVR